MKSDLMGGVRPRSYALDLFSGAGGLSLGLAAAGVRFAAAVDSDPRALATLRLNSRVRPLTTVCRDIRKFGPRQMQARLRALSPRITIDWIVGGPPCQGWSTIGRAKLRSLGRLADEGPAYHEPRNRLYRSFLGYVAHFRPKFFLMENVPGMRSYNGDDHALDIREQFSSLGYEVTLSMVDCHRLGLPQRRRRIAFVGIREDLRAKFTKPRGPPRDLGIRGNPPVVRDAIADLPRVPVGSDRTPIPYSRPEEPSSYLELMRPEWMNGSIDRHVTRWHGPKDLLAFRTLEQGGIYSDLPENLRRYRSDIFRDRFRRLAWREPAPCLTAHLAKDCYSHIHPSQARTISVREAARLQSFPDWYSFEGAMGDVFRQIGNSVPPLAAYALGRGIQRAVGDTPTSTWADFGERIGKVRP